MVTGRDVAPGQVRDLGVQAGLVLLHDQDVVGLLVADQEPGVLALSVHRVGGDYRPGQVQEAAAEALGLPFSTYRRHLARAIDGVTEALWAVEIGTARRPD
jgi:hypothetical protein